MEIEFHKRQIEGAISTRDEIELYNCEDHQMNGNYIVANVEPETGDVTLIGTGGKSGMVTVICLGGDDSADDGSEPDGDEAVFAHYGL